LSGPALAQALRWGGYVIFFRHAATTPILDDVNPVVLAGCATQRNLSPAVQEFRRLGIPVGRVLTSPFCRALDTVKLAFDKAQIEPGLENL